MKNIWWIKGQIDQGFKGQMDQGLKSNFDSLQLPQMTGLSPSQLSSYSKVVFDLKKILKNSELFKLMLLVSVTQSVHPRENKFSGLQSTYLRVFWRKLNFNFSKSLKESGGENIETKMADDVINDVVISLNKVRNFCEIFAKA